jgi:hypothetical protein
MVRRTTRMGKWLLFAVTVAYVSYARQRRYGMMLAFIGYALANLGFIRDVGEHP